MAKTFACNGEESVNEELLVKRFVVAQAQDKVKKAPVVEVVVVKKEMLWIGTEKTSPDKVRQRVAIIGKKLKKLVEELLPTILVGDLGDLLADFKFNVEDIATLDDVLGSVIDDEWARLRDETAPETYMWDDNIEGFCAQFDERAKSIIGVIMAHFELSEATVAMSEQLDEVQAGIHETLQSQQVKSLLKKVLYVGNCLNAGDKQMGRADGFDCVDLLIGQLCMDMPKGSDGVSLLEHIRQNELSPEDVEAWKDLVEVLKPWDRPDEKEDQADLDDLQKEKNILEKMLNKSQTLMEKHNVDTAFLKPHFEMLDTLEARLDFLRGGDDPKGEGIVELQRYLFHNPAKDKTFAVGRILGYVNILAQRCIGVKPNK